MGTTGKQPVLTNAELKIGLFRGILKHFQEAQYSGRNHNKLLKELKRLYYQQTNPNEAKEYQKLFFSLSLQAMLIPFRELKCKAQERMISLYTKFVLSAGTDIDKETFDYDIRNLPAFYTYFIRNYQHNHSDRNPHVRLRLIELLLQILKAKHAEAFMSSEKTRTRLKNVLTDRIKDKVGSIRAVACRCLQLLITNSDDKILKQLNFHAEYDPHLQTRKCAFSAIVNSGIAIKPSFIVKKAYDSSESIRIEAFKALIRVPFSKISASQRSRLLQWGLLQQNEGIIRIVTEELIPSWIKDEICGNDLFKLLVYLDISRNPEATALFFRSFISNDREETLDKVSLNFLDEDKVVPVDDISLEKIIFWRYLCQTFINKPYCLNKILPEPGKLVVYIDKLIQVIHEETEEARANDADEEIEKILCLSQILRIAELCEYEEGSRKSMQSYIRKILLDDVLDEVVVIHSAIDIAHKLVEMNAFSDFMIQIVNEIFNAEQPLPPLRTVSFDIVNSHQQPEQSGTSSTPHPSGSSHTDEEIEGMDGRAASHIRVNEMDQERKESVRRDVEVSATENDILKLKTERANLALQRHRLIGQKDAAVKASKLVEAQRLHEEIEVMESKENNLHGRICEMEKRMQDISLPLTPERCRNDSRFLSPIQPAIPSFCGAIRTPVLENRRDSIFLNNSGIDEFSNLDGLEPANISTNLSQYLRGIVILTRYLGWERNISPYVKIIYDTHIFECLEHEDYRVRMHAMYLICMVGIVDRTEARKSMAIFIQGLTHEEERVKIAAFKCMVDLLLQYDYSVFKIQEEDEEFISELPYPLNEVAITTEEVGAEFTRKIMEFVEEGDENEIKMGNLLVKVLGVMKLLLRHRIMDVKVVSWLLNLWTNSSYTGSPICFNIGNWLPIFMSTGREIVLVVVKALISCVKDILGENEDVGDNRKEYLSKLGSFVLSNIKFQELEPDQDATTEEQVVLLILTEINHDVGAPHVLTMAKFLKLLAVQTEQGCKIILARLSDIIEAVEMLPVVIQRKLITQFTSFETELRRRFRSQADSGCSANSLPQGNRKVRTEDNVDGSEESEN